MNDEYDVRKAFEEMELELIASMKRNLQRHLDWEEKEKFNWNMWQVEQLKTLENFKKENQRIFNKKFSSINAEVANFLQSSFETSGFEEEKKILQELAKGLFVNANGQKGIDSSFFSLNKNKMNALIRATTSDLEKAEYAMLRMTNDQYRKIIFNAQVMANSGSFTLAQSVDKASKDFLRSGINCIQYKDGRRVNIASYAEMSIRTANKRAVLISEGDVRNNYGIHTIRISKYGGCSETCLPWQGRIYVDDVYSGGTKEEAQEKNLTLLSEAIAGGLFHPNCKHRATTYFYDLKKSLGKLEDDGVENSPKEQEHRKNQMHIQQQKRLQNGFLDSSNIQQAKNRKEMWETRDKKLMKSENNNEKFDYIPKVFQFSDTKESNLIDVYINLDRKFMKDGFEHMAIVDGESGKLLKAILSSGSKTSVVPDEETLRFIVEKESKSLTLIHNHPKSTPFSITDIITTNEINSIKESIVINNDGEIYFLSIPYGKEIDLSDEKLRRKFKDDIIKQREECTKEFPDVSKKDIIHLSYMKFFKRLGWHYGRKRYR